MNLNRVLIYTRVSSQKQNHPGKVSLEVQRELCLNWAEEHFPDLPISTGRKDVGSAFGSFLPKTKKFFSKLSNKVIVCKSIDRFSRCYTEGKKMLELLRDNENRVVFVENKLEYDFTSSTETWKKVLIGLYAAELSSRQNSNMQHFCASFRRLGFVDIQDAQYCEVPNINIIEEKVNPYDLQIATLIMNCRKNLISLDDFNMYVKNLSSVRAHRTSLPVKKSAITSTLNYFLIETSNIPAGTWTKENVKLLSHLAK